MKRIILFLLLMALPVFGAAQTCTWDNVGGDYNWHNAANWATTVEADRVPLTGDSVVFNNTVNDNCLLTSNSAANMTDLTMTGYTGVLAMANNNLDFDGDVVLDGMITASIGAVLYCRGDFTKTTSMTALPVSLTVELNGTGNVTCNSVGGGRLVINTSGTHTAIGAGAWTRFTMQGGTYNPNSQNHTIASDIVRTGGTMTRNGKFIMTGAGNLAWDNEGSRFAHLELQDATAMTGSVRLLKLTLGASAVITDGSGARRFYFFKPSSNFWTADTAAVVNVKLSLYVETLVSIGTSVLKLINKDIEIDRGSFLAGAAIDLGTGTVQVRGVEGTADLDMATHSLTCDDIILGYSSGHNTVVVDLGSGSHAISGDIKAHASSSGTLILELSTSRVALIGEFDGSGISCRSDASGVHPEIHGGTVSNVSMPLDDEALDCTDNVTDGGSNVNCWMPGVLGVHSVIGGGFIGSGAVQ